MKIGSSNGGPPPATRRFVQTVKREMMRRGVPAEIARRRAWQIARQKGYEMGDE